MGRDKLRQRDLERIEAALRRAAETVAEFTPGAIEYERKRGGDPVTEADERIDQVLRELLPAGDEGWLSEETVDDAARLERRRVWVVDPLDGTREFIQGIPEWCISVGLVEEGQAVAGGIYNPSTDQVFLASLETGLTLNGEKAGASHRTSLESAVVLASRSEVRRGEWERFEGGPYEVRPTGSVAFKLACVAAGLVDATWTLVPKNEWDIAAGVALVRAGGGEVYDLSGALPSFNNRSTLKSGLIAHGGKLRDAVWEELDLPLEGDGS
jgi:myo-inositol-1(or 4)-monophosphatase